MAVITALLKLENGMVIGAKERQEDDVYELLYLIKKSINQNTISDMYAYILENNIDHPALYLFMPRTDHWTFFSALYEKYLLTVLDKNPSKSNKAAACYSLAAGYFMIYQTMRKAEFSGKKYATYLTEDLGADLSDPNSIDAQNSLHWNDYAAEDVKAQAIKYAERAKTDYAKENLYYCSVDKEDNLQARQVGSVGEKIDSLLYQLDHFSIGRSVPNISFKTIGGKTVNLFDRNGKIALVDFWSSGCGPCREKMPFLMALQKTLTGQPFDLIMLNTDKERESLDKCIDELDLHDLDIVHLGQDPILKEWGITGFPTFLLIDQRGILRNRTNFVDEKTVAEIAILLDTAGEPHKQQSTSSEGKKDFSSVELLKTFSKSMGKWAKSGLKQASPELVKIRLDTCRTCPHFQEQGKALVQKIAAKAGFGDGNCSLCGCSIQAKARILIEDCPNGAPLHDNMSPWTLAEKRAIL